MPSLLVLRDSIANMRGSHTRPYTVLPIAPCIHVTQQAATAAYVHAVKYYSAKLDKNSEISLFCL